MKRFIALVMFFLFAGLLYLPIAFAETKFDYGATLRLRQEIWDDVVDLGLSKPDRNFFRLRVSPWIKADFSKDTGIYLRLTTEPKYHLGPFKPNVPRNDDRLDEDELVIDNLYFAAHNVFGLPVDLKIGRQDFLGPDTYGEGFLILDGTPGDGSRTFYFNAIKAKVKINPENTIDLVYISDPRKDIYLPTLYTPPDKKQLTASNEQAFVIYSKNKVSKNFLIEPYYIYKREKEIGSTPKLKLNTLGARAVFTIESWRFGGEFAYQFGEYTGGRDRTGNGGYIFVGRKYENVALRPEFDIRYIYLSGDDPNTTDHEGWDPLFSRNPYWNEVYIYHLPAETSKDSGPIPGYWTNLSLLKFAVKLNFSAATNLSLSYQYLWAPEKTASTVPLFTNDSHNRGHVGTAILSHKFSKNLDGMLQFEIFSPEGFYSNSASTAKFFRWQLMYKI